MSNLMRYRSLDDLFNEMTRGFLVRPLAGGERELEMKLDIKEDEKAYKVRADIPGVKKDDIHVTVDGNEVTIRAEVKEEKEEKQGEKMLCKERYEGMISRSFDLPYEVDLASAAAKYSDGILDLTLPKKTDAGAAKRLTVQ